jgi:hypothetical protein
MKNKSVVAALALGFLGFMLSVLPVTTAEAKCIWRSYQHSCSPGERESRFEPTRGVDGGETLCCTTPKEPYATGESESERQGRFAKECAARGANYHYDEQKGSCIKVIGNAVGECERKGPHYNYDPETRSCVKTIARNKTPEACEGQGPNYHYDPQTGGCIKTISRVKPPNTSGGAGGE